MNRISMVILRLVSCPDSFQNTWHSSGSRWSFLTICIALSGLVSTGKAEWQGDYGYSTNGPTVAIVDYAGLGGNIIVPNTILGKQVTSIGDNAFSKRCSLTSITIPEGVTNIGNYAFSGCTGLTSITIPNSVSSIGIYAFYNCHGLADVTIPNNVTAIRDSTFIGCAGLTNITIPSAVTAIERQAFSGCSRLTNIAIPTNVIRIGDSAFNYCVGLQDITIPSKVGIIYASAFANCTGLTNVAISNGAAIILSSAFSGCTGLTGFTVPAGAFTIDYGTFSDCTGLMSVVIPNSVTNIGNLAFSGCASLTNITLPGKVTAIGWNAFAACTNLRNITIPNSVTKIADYAFMNCAKLTDLIIPDGVTDIGNATFSGCSGLTGIAIPKGVTSIGDGTFSGCVGLTEFTISSNVTSIGSMALAGCSGLTDITVDALNKYFGSVDGILFSRTHTKLIQFPAGTIGSYAISNGVTVLANGAFNGCSYLTDITIPASVSLIEDSSLANCHSLTNITVDKLNPSYASVDGALLSKDLTLLIQCPNGKIGSYEIPSSVTSIAFNAFAGCNLLTNVTISGGNIRIGYAGFLDCTGLTSISVDPLNSDFTSIDGVLFAKNPLMLIQYPRGRIGGYLVPDNVVRIGDRAFYNCAGLTDITISTNVAWIGDWSFAGCAGLTNVIISNGTSLIGESAFRTCTNLKGITIPNSVATIGNNAFDGCISLTNITFPNSIRDFGYLVFNDCSNLTSVIFEGNAPTPDPYYLMDAGKDVPIYYRIGTTGWTTTFAGQPTAISRPSYLEWAGTMGLLDEFPASSAEGDDPDHDGMSNLLEWQAATDPTDSNSVLKFESAPRPDSLADADKTDIGPDQHALYLQTVPGNKYKLESVSAFHEVWQTETAITATTSQKRVLVTKPIDQRFYRVVLVP